MGAESNGAPGNAADRSVGAESNGASPAGAADHSIGAESNGTPGDAADRIVGAESLFLQAFFQLWLRQIDLLYSWKNHIADAVDDEVDDGLSNGGSTEKRLKKVRLLCRNEFCPRDK